MTFSGVVDLVTDRQQRGFVVALQMLGLVALDEQQPVRLDLGRTKIRDEHLRFLQQFSQLEQLTLSNTSIGDVGVAHLAHVIAVHDAAGRPGRRFDP